LTNGDVAAVSDVLVLNTGSVPVHPSVPGLDGARVHCLSTELGPARRLEARIPSGQSAAILGGGAIGLEMAETLVQRGYNAVHLLVSAPHVLSRYLDAELAERTRHVFGPAGDALIQACEAMLKPLHLRRREITRGKDKSPKG